MFKEVEFINEMKENTIRVDVNRLVKIKNIDKLEGGVFIEVGTYSVKKIEVRNNGNLKNNALFLPIEFDYELVIDDEGCNCLLVLKKGD